MRPSTDKPTGGTADDPFRYGWRDVTRTLPDGSKVLEQVPLTLEDVLYPLEGDHIAHNTQHARDCRYLADVFTSRAFGPPHTKVTDDLGIVFGVEGIGRPSPDIAVFTGLTRPLPPMIGELVLPDWGGRCELVVEVVSPSTRTNDVETKVALYHAVGVRCYVIIDQEKEDGPRRALAYRHTPEGWQSIELDARGQLELPLLGLRLGIAPDRVVCYDSRTGQELGDYSAITRALEEADRRFEQQNQAIEEQVLARQEAERLAKVQAQALREAERLAERQAHALQEADRLGKEQAQALQEADRLGKNQAQALQEADRLAEQQAQALQEAERAADQQRRESDKANQRIKELEALLQRLQAGGSADAPTA